MSNNELFIISTSKKSAPPNTQQLLKMESIDFAAAFYPLIGVSKKGKEMVINSGNDLSEELLIIIIDHAKNLSQRPDFLEKISSRVKSLNKLYLLFHMGAGSIYSQHQEDILQSCKHCLSKIRVSKGHHSTLLSDNPDYALGNGLEKLAEVILRDPFNVDINAFNEAIEYLRIKPAYSSPYKGALIHLYKSLSIILVKLKGNKWTEDNFKKEKDKWDETKLEKVKLAEAILDSLMFKEINGVKKFVSREDFLENMDLIKQELIKISSDL